MSELYFCLHLTESEHWIVESNFIKKCKELGLTLSYYRELKDGHIPMYREIKIVGEKENLNRFEAWMVEDYYSENIKKNPNKDNT